MRGLVICVEARIDRGKRFVHRLDQREARQVVDQHLVVDVSDDIDVGGPAAAEPSLQVLRCNSEKCQPAVANPEVERHRVQKEGGNRAPARIPLVWTVALLVGWSEAVGGSGTVQRRDAGATNGQRDAAREVSIGHLAECGPRSKCHEEAGLLVPPPVRRDLRVVAEQDSCLSKRGRGWNAAPVGKRFVPLSRHEVRYEGHVALLDGSGQARVAEAIDVNHDQPATRRSSLFDLPCRIAPGIRSRRVASTPPDKARRRSDIGEPHDENLGQRPVTGSES